MDGLEGDTRDARAGLFGENVIEIEEKPVLKLLVDEVPSRPLFFGYYSSVYLSCLLSPYLLLSSCPLPFLT